MPEPVPHQESVYAALLTAAAGVFTTTLTLLVGWLHDRGADARRASATKQLLDRVQLLGAWYLTRTWVSPEDVESSRALVKQELDLALCRARCAHASTWLGRLACERNPDCH